MTNFIEKLYNMLQDGLYQEWINWSDNGKSFVIVNSSSFAENVLGKVFKHNNFVSFVRQLNIYNFHKINRTYHRINTVTAEERAAEPREFYNENFLRDVGRDKIKLINRKQSNQAIRKVYQSLGSAPKGKKPTLQISPPASPMLNDLQSDDDDFEDRGIRSCNSAPTFPIIPASSMLDFDEFNQIRRIDTAPNSPILPNEHYSNDNQLAQSILSSSSAPKSPIIRYNDVPANQQQSENDQQYEIIDSPIQPQQELLQKQAELFATITRLSSQLQNALERIQKLESHVFHRQNKHTRSPFQTEYQTTPPTGLQTLLNGPLVQYTRKKVFPKQKSLIDAWRPAF